LEQLFLEDFGVPHTEIFKNFNEEPIAAASLAQVIRRLGFFGLTHCVLLDLHF